MYFTIRKRPAGSVLNHTFKLFQETTFCVIQEQDGIAFFPLKFRFVYNLCLIPPTRYLKKGPLETR